jgi:hypothetical protein
MLKPILLALAASALAAGQASAHARLLRSDPQAGATVASPAQLRLAFSETIVPGKSSVALLAPDGKPAPLGRLALDPKDPRVVLVPTPQKLAPGAYKVKWTMTTADTHRTDGAFSFKVK